MRYRLPGPNLEGGQRPRFRNDDRAGTRAASLLPQSLEELWGPGLHATRAYFPAAVFYNSSRAGTAGPALLAGRNWHAVILNPRIESGASHQQHGNEATGENVE